MNWKELYDKMAGVYISDIYDLSSNFDAYFETIDFSYQKNDGDIEVYIRTSSDGGLAWSDWIKINDSAYSPFFNDEDIDMSQMMFQYKVILDNRLGGQKAVFDHLKIDLIGVARIVNTGDLVSKPEIWIKKTNGSGDIKIHNETTGETLELKNLFNGEVVYIDCENEDIVTSDPIVYRYDDHNNVFLEFEVGENLISGEGDFQLDMRFEFKTLQG